MLFLKLSGIVLLVMHSVFVVSTCIGTQGAYFRGRGCIHTGSHLTPLAKMAAPYSSLTGWIPRPAPFNASKHGKLVKFSEECSVAEREGDFWNGVAYTAQPVPLGELWRIIDSIDK